MAKPMGPTRCSRQAVQAQVRATLPVFWGMRGSTNTMFSVGLWFGSILPPPYQPCCGQSRGSSGSNQTPKRVSCPAGVFWMANETNSAALSAAALRALP